MTRYDSVPGGQVLSVIRTMLPWHHHPGHPHVVVPVRIDPAGVWGPTPKAARCGGWRRVAPGWFVPARVDPTDVDQRVVEAALRIGSRGAVTGWAALHWRGARWFARPGAPVPLALGDAGATQGAGRTVSEERLLAEDVEVVDGLRVTTAVRSVLFEMRHAADVVAATVALDMASYDDLVSIDEAAAHAAQLGTWTGIPRARAALALADENAWSPAEVPPRTVWARHAGLGAPLTNAPVFDLSGRRLVTPDLIDPERGVVGEYDGAGHLERGSQRHDVDRDELYRRLGLEQVTWLAHDLVDLDRASNRLLLAHARAAARPVSDRQWTVVPPPWWKPTRTVTQRRELSPEDRVRLLGYRVAR